MELKKIDKTRKGELQTTMVTEGDNLKYSSHLPVNAYNTKLITYFLCVHLYANLLLNVDNGIVPSSSIDIKKQLTLN